MRHPPEQVKIGLMGLGTVGSGVMRLLRDRGEELARRNGFTLSVQKILVRDPSKPRQVPVDRALLTTNPDDILDDPEIELVVEVMGAVEPTKSYVLRALGAKKSVVTANKEIMADHGEEVFAAAEHNGVDIFFEGSVGGGIPVLRPLKESLAGNRIFRVTGIINGTTNYILTKMTQEGQTFQQALAEATRLGYAEPDPTADVEGYDAARKLAILSSIAYQARVQSRNVRTEGITRLTPTDIEYGKRRGWSLKLLAESSEHDGRVDAWVAPVFIDRNHPLAKVDDVLNAILVEGEGIGETMFYGRGAGSLPTGSAVLGDIIQAARNRRREVSFTTCTCFRDVTVGGPEESPARFYLRIEVEKRSGLPAEVVRSLERWGIGLERMDYRDLPPSRAEVVLVTQEAPESRARTAIEALGRAPWLVSMGMPIRVEAEEERAPAGESASGEKLERRVLAAGGR